MINRLIYYLVISVLFFSACRHTSEIISIEPVDETEPPEYLVIYYIHADGDYLFHDSDGRPVHANERVLDTAVGVAENAKSGEVFIFHQRPQKKLFWLFPRRSSEFYYFKNGEKINRIAYHHAENDENFLATETGIYHRYKSGSAAEGHQKYLLFFGHEIPADQGRNYHLTLPDIEVTNETFAAGILGFLDEENNPFDLVVLSACSNGTPSMAKHLLPYADYLLASPQNLHLSHIDSERLRLLETNSGISPAEIAYKMAEQTYNRLVESIQTSVTLTVYDLYVVREYIHELYALTREYEDKERPNPYLENIDCNKLSFFDSQTYSRGLKSWYRPARFGRQTGSASHSGWGCRGL